MDDLGAMFADLSFDMLSPSSPAAPAAPATSTVSSRPPTTLRGGQQMMTLRGVSGVNLDDLILNEESKRKWKSEFAKGDEVEAEYAEDGVFYLAVIDALLEDPQMYLLTFTEYGNSQQTHESKIRLTLAKKMELAQAVAQKEAQKEAQKASRGKQFGRTSHGHIQAPDFSGRAPTLAGKSVEEKRRASETSSANMSAAFSAMLADANSSVAGPLSPGSHGKENQSGCFFPLGFTLFLSDYSSMSVLPPLPAEAPPIAQQDAYKDYMRLRYEYQNRGLLEAAPSTRKSAAESSSGHARTKSLGRSSAAGDALSKSTASPKPSRFGSAFKKK